MWLESAGERSQSLWRSEDGSEQSADTFLSCLCAVCIDEASESTGEETKVVPSGPQSLGRGRVARMEGTRVTRDLTVLTVL